MDELYKNLVKLNQCGKCCMNREDILCTPKDVFRISKKLGISTYDFIKKYCDSYLGDTSHMPIVRIVPHDAAGHCPLLENNKCVVHECKPVVCAMYPIGRTICIDTSVKNSKDMNVKDIEFLFTHPIRCGKTETHTVREWLTQFGIRQEDLAERCNCSVSHIAHIEKGLGKPSLEMVVIIANKLGVTVDQLLGTYYNNPEIIYLREIAERIDKYDVS